MPDFAPVTARLEHRADGSLLLHSGRDLGEGCVPLGERLAHWAAAAPDRPLLHERQGDGWRCLTYGQASNHADRIATGLLGLGCSSEQPLLILAGNSIEHALFTLAAHRIGVPVAPVSAAYAAHDTFDRLTQLVGVSGAGAAFVGPDIPRAAWAALADQGLAIVASGSFDDTAPDYRLVQYAAGRVTADSIAKLMFTSGSTGTPKAVINTHRMMAANQLQLTAIWPAANKAPPVLVDWLPWSHTFGGNFVFNMALWNGGTLVIDDGRPAPTLVGRTLAAMAEHGPTRYFSVPAGFEALIPAIEAHPDLARQACRNLEFAFCAAAALPSKAHERLRTLLRETCGRDIPVIGGWGSTETAPCLTAIHFPNEHPASIGVPVPGVTIKLVPANGKLELRARGPNVMPGYWRAPEATAAAFDEEGFYRIGDAGRFVDPAHPEAGLAFDGRIAENFKLSSGTWVNVGALRLAIMDATRPYVHDAVIAGHDQDSIGVLLFLNEASCRAACNIGAAESLALSEALHNALRHCLDMHNSSAGGNSMRVARFLVETTPPSAEIGETTDKGYINQRAVLQARAASVEAMFADDRHKLGAG